MQSRNVRISDWNRFHILQFMWAYYVNPAWWVIAHSLSPSDQQLSNMVCMQCVHVLALGSSIIQKDTTSCYNVST